jgi:hypothetical protein
MQKFFLKTSFGIGLLIFCLVAKSQAFQANYTYDANGNRITASVIYLTTSLKSAEIPINQVIKDSTILADSVNIPRQGWDNPRVEPINGLDIKLYPNPTHGLLLIEVSGAGETQALDPGNKIDVYDMNGQLVLHISPLSTYNTVNFLAKSNGNYLLKVTIMGQVKNYKIIKN